MYLKPDIPRKCEQKFCVYWMNHRCILDEISIDETGMCTDCINTNIDGKLLDKLRQRHLDELSEREKYQGIKNENNQH